MSITKGYKAEWLSIDDLPVILAIKGFEPISSIIAHKAICNISAHGGDIEERFKLNELSVNIFLHHTHGNYDTIRIHHPNNKFFKGNGVVLGNEKDMGTSFRTESICKKRSSEELPYEKIKGILL